jgi:hypothetical protein
MTQCLLLGSTSVAEARSSLWQEQDFSSKDHCGFAPQREPFFFRNDTCYP